MRDLRRGDKGQLIKQLAVSPCRAKKGKVQGRDLKTSVGYIAHHVG